MTTKGRRLLAALMLLSGTAHCAAPGDTAGTAPPSRLAASPLVSFLSPLLIPKLIGDGAEVKAYVRSPEFAAVRRRAGDRRSIDFLFRTSLSIAWDNTAEGLLLTFFSVMDHRSFGVKAPLIGTALWVPLTSEFDDDFRRRVDALPTNLYPDTPPGRSGDRDKLQHFFGSAFLTYVTESDGAAERMGSFIEWGEDLFIVGGVSDPRDLRANAEGRDFARALLDDPDALPSTCIGGLFRHDGPPIAQDSLRVHREAE